MDFTRIWPETPEDLAFYKSFASARSYTTAEMLEIRAAKVAKLAARAAAAEPK